MDTAIAMNLLEIGRVAYPGLRGAHPFFRMSATSRRSAFSPIPKRDKPQCGSSCCDLTRLRISASLSEAKYARPAADAKMLTSRSTFLTASRPKGPSERVDSITLIRPDLWIRRLEGH